MITSAEANDRLMLPSNGPALDRKHWRTKPSQAPVFLPILDRIKTLATGGLTSMHVVGNFLKRRITPLQRRARLCCWRSQASMTVPKQKCRHFPGGKRRA